MSTETVNHLTRKAAGKMKIINCNNMQGRHSLGRCRDCTCTDSSARAAEKMEFSTVDISRWILGCCVFFTARTGLSVSERKRHRRMWDTQDKTRQDLGTTAAH